MTPLRTGRVHGLKDRRRPSAGAYRVGVGTKLGDSITTTKFGRTFNVMLDAVLYAERIRTEKGFHSATVWHRNGRLVWDSQIGVLVHFETRQPERRQGDGHPRRGDGCAACELNPSIHRSDSMKFIRSTPRSPPSPSFSSRLPRSRSTPRSSAPCRMWWWSASPAR